MISTHLKREIGNTQMGSVIEEGWVPVWRSETRIGIRPLPDTLFMICTALNPRFYPIPFPRTA